MKDRLDRITSIVTALAAVAFAVVVVRRELLPQRAPSGVDTTPQYVSEWKDVIRTAGRVLGPPQAPVQLVEFMDLECPFCKRYHPTVETILEKFPNEVSLVYVHFPISSHRFARPAARAAECAGVQGRFLPMVDAVFARQDSLGLRSWAAFAHDAGVRDTVVFNGCYADTTTFASIDVGLATGRRIGVTGTPALMLNGWLMNGPPTDKELIRAVGELLQGREPYADSKK